MTVPANSDQSSVSFMPARGVRRSLDSRKWRETFFQILANTPHSGHRSGQLGSKAEVLDHDLVEGLRKLSEASHVSLADAVLAGFAIVLFRYTGESEFEIALHNPISSAKTDSPQVVPIYLSEDKSFLQTCRDVSDSRVASISVASKAISPLCFWEESSQRPATILSGLPIDLGMGLAQGEQGVSLCLWYAADLFEKNTISRFLRSLITLLSNAVANPDSSIGLLTMLASDERRQVVEDWNRTNNDAWRDQCLHALVEEQAERSPDHIAVEQNGVRLTYAELNAKANQLANYLLEHGASFQSHIGVCLEPSAEFAIATIAVLKAGCACLPLDPKYPSDRLAYMLEDSGAKILLTRRDGTAASLPNGLRAIDLSVERNQVARASNLNPALSIPSTAIAYVIYTSGSTGKPRGVLLRHVGLANYNLAAAHYFEISPRDRVLQFCSLSFDAAIEEIFATLISGATLVFRSKDMPLDVPGFLTWVRRKKISILDLPTAYWHEWVSQFSELTDPIPSGLRLVVVGGEKALASALATWRGVAGNVRWVNTYGPTEASIAVTRYDPGMEHPNALPSHVPIGRPIENCRVYVLDQHRAPVPIGVPGELYIGGVSVAAGYLNREELTSAKFVLDPFTEDASVRLYRTGDLARFHENGLLEYLGREDDQVKIRGFRVELGEIEELLVKHPRVSESAVVAVNDPIQGKTLIAFCSPATELALDPSDLRAFVGGKLPEFMIPARFVILDFLPKTPNGKIDRRTLSRAELSPSVPTKVVDAPATPLQTRLKNIWEETLGRKPIGVRENFFELGGHSLLAARLMQRVSRFSGQTVPLALLFEAPTIEKLADVLERNEWPQKWSCLVPIQPRGSRPPFFCVHGIGGNVVGFRELARLMSPDYPFYGFQAQGLDGTQTPFSSIEDMAARYIREMRNIQADGPFRLGGYSFGGLVAYEMAKQLHEGGEEVALLALLDTYPGELEPVTSSLWKLMLEPKRLRMLGDLPGTAKKSVRRRLKGLFLSKTLKSVLRANHRASAKYLLRPYEGKTTLFRAEQSSLRAFDDPHAAWRGLAVGGLEIEEIDGDHGDILMVPQVDELAKKLKVAINRSVPESLTNEASKEEALA